MSGQQIDTSVNTNPELYQTGGAGQNAVPEAVQDDFAELVQQTIQQELQQAGVVPPGGQGGAGTGEISPDAQKMLDEGNIEGFIEQMVKDALEEAGLIPPSSEGQGTEGGSGSGGGSGGTEGAGEPNPLVDQILEALEAAGSGGQGGGSMLGQTIGDQVEKLVEEELGKVQGITPNSVGGNEPTNGYVPATDEQPSGTSDSDAFNSETATYLNDVMSDPERAAQVSDPENTIFGNYNDSFGIETPNVNTDGLNYERSVSSAQSIDGVNTESNYQFSSDGRNDNSTRQINNDGIPNAA